MSGNPNGFRPNGGHIARALLCVIALVSLFIAYNAPLDLSAQSGGSGGAPPTDTATAVATATETYSNTP